jgi:lysophospholipase L1-like esterase
VAESLLEQPSASDVPAPALVATDTADLAVELGWPPPSDELEKAQSAARARVLGVAKATEPAEHGARPPPPLGQLVRIENEERLEHFHSALARLGRGEAPDGKVRILAYGASHTQADFYTGYLRAYLQQRFGDGGRGFVLIGRVNAWHRTLDTKARQRHMQVHHARSRLGTDAEPLGLFGAALVGNSGDAYAEVTFAPSSPNTEFELAYLAQPGGGTLKLSLDGVPIGRLPTRAQAPSPGYYRFSAPAGAHTIRVRLLGDGPVRLYGLIAEARSPGVVLDTLGIGGARFVDSLRWQNDAWSEAMRHRAPDLVTFAYGTNEAFDDGLSLGRYANGVREVLTRLRQAVPEASCLLVAPFDLPNDVRPRLVDVLAVQRELARELGCGFWDGYTFMGGAGTIHTWASAKPPFATHDLVHLTRLGYARVGEALAAGLMRRYDLERSAPQGVSVGALDPSR